MSRMSIALMRWLGTTKISNTVGFEVEGRFVRWLHVKRHGVMLVRSHPPAVNVSEANSRSHPLPRFAPRPS